LAPHRDALIDAALFTVSWHGDMTNGWDTTALQNSIDQCNYANNTGQAGGA
jgi:hypothetical protein